ncbi:MAG TPA: radical SAM protein [Elusimicrobiales bacterium]|nr:radical SAM protein [Elusimicrobiales bacterium]
MKRPGPAARLNELTLAHNIPAALTIELTRRCPLSCAHCYLPETRGRSSPAEGRELTAGQWKRVLGQFARAGAMQLVFTGGEPLLRPDLEELCAFACRLRFDVRVYSSGSGLDRSRAGALKSAGVSSFELSLYGRPVTHDAVTGRAGSFLAVMSAAKLLKKAGIAVAFKTPLMKGNVRDAAWLLALAKTHGCRIYFDPVISPANDGDRSNLRFRLSGRALSAAVRTIPSLLPRLPSQARKPAPSDFLCGAGRNVAAVDPYGNLSPCLQLPIKIGNLLRTPFTTLWRSSPRLRKWRELNIGDLPECGGCGLLPVCSRCPGISLLERGDVLSSNVPACHMAAIMAGGPALSEAGGCQSPFNVPRKASMRSVTACGGCAPSTSRKSALPR